MWPSLRLDSHLGADYLHTVASLQATEEQAVADGNSVRASADEGTGETSLAAATAAIITARWNVAARRASGSTTAQAPPPAPAAPPMPPPVPPSAPHSPAPPVVPAPAATVLPPAPPSESVAPTQGYRAAFDDFAVTTPSQRRAAIDELAPPKDAGPRHDPSPRYESPSAYAEPSPAPSPTYEPGAGYEPWQDNARQNAQAYPQTQRSDPAPEHTVPAQRSPEPSPLDQPLDQSVAVSDDFVPGSVVSDLPFPKEPFIPETYDAGPWTTEGTSPQQGNGHVGASTEAPAPEQPRQPEGAGEPQPSSGPAASGASPSGAYREAAPPAAEQAAEPVLPQRVPAVPDVPDVPLPPNDPLRDPAAAPTADRRELSRIAHYLREDDRTQTPEQRPEGFDVAAILEAVRAVPDVRDAQLRWNPGSGHTLRIEFAEGADEGRVTREVTRVLREKLGLSAERSDAGLSSDEPTLDRPTPAQPAAPAASARAPVATPRTHSASRPVPGALQARPAGPLPPPDSRGGAGERVIVDHVQVTTLGVEATVEVRLVLDGTAADSSRRTVAIGTGQGPAVDAYLLRLAANAAADAVNQLLYDQATGVSRARCFVEHVAVVPFGVCDVAVVVLLLVSGTFAEQLSGSALVVGDPPQAVVRATLAALNRRLESLLP